MKATPGDRWRGWARPALALGALCLAPEAGAGRSAVYGGGPFYSGGQPVMNTLRASGFTTVVLWTIHVRANSGDLVFNDQLVVSNGSYVGDPGWPGRLRTLKQAPTSVNRIEVTVGSAGPDDWRTIHQLITAQGTGSGSILFRNFKVLKEVTGADAINDDDEAHFDVNSTTQFARMAVSLGYKFTLVPFNNSSFWASLKRNLGSAVDRVYLQAYAGGSGNNPADWSRDLGMPIDPGLWSKHGNGCAEGDSPSRFESQMRAWRTSANIPGGFLWLYDDLQRCPGGGSPAQYARAINTGTGGGGGGGDGVVFFQDINFGGGASQPLARGSYTLSQLQARGVPNDWASSARVPGGLTVIFFQHDNFTGTSWSFGGDMADFRNLSPNGNDQMSSCRIQ